MKFSDIADRVKPSETIQMSKRSRELQAEGKDVINLSLGEPDFDTPEVIKDAAKKALDEGKTKYTPVAGIPELRQAIVDKLQRENKLSYTTDQIVVSCGAKHSIANVLMALIDPGDRILIPSPYWVTYEGISEMLGAEVDYVPTTIDTRFKLTPELLEKSIKSDTRVMIFSSPCNPSGEVYSQDELDALALVLQQYPELVVISDEIYEYINFDGVHASIARSPDMQQRTVIINGASKGFAMTGWRLGYMAAPLPIAQKCELIQSQVTSGICSISQWAMVTALGMDRSEVYQMRDQFQKRRDYIIQQLQQIEGIRVLLPEGAFYAYPDVSYYFGKSTPSGGHIHNANDLAMYLLEECLVATVSGTPFGTPECIRISYASDMASIEEACKRIQQGLQILLN